MTKEEVLKMCEVTGNIARLPDIQLDRKLYLEVKKAMDLIGGKWKGGKVSGFVFDQDPSEMLGQVANGEKRDLKKEYQFFATPDTLADYLVELAFTFHSVRGKILEPSAGQGAIMKAIRRYDPDSFIYVCELMELNRKILFRDIKNFAFLKHNFLELAYFHHDRYDTIIANPPFSKNQDIDHVYKMFKCLSEGGRLVSIVSNHWKLSTNRKETEFREWLHYSNANEYEIEPGTFKESGTMIGGTILVIDK